MASRQNREMRPEYPTGHNRGNESPSRRVPGGANPVAPPEDVDVKAYGAPMGVPPVDESREAERERKLATTPKPGEASERIETHIQEGIDETQRAELEAEADARTAGRQEKPTADLSAMTAADRLAARKKAQEQATLEAGK